MEIAMIITLAVMGIYFFKSTDLPKDMKERSAQLKTQSIQQSSSKDKDVKINLPKELVKNPIVSKDIDAKLAEMKLQKKLKEIKVINEEIDKLTLTITMLEQEIKANNERNSEIQSIIDSHLVNLQLLQEKIALLS
jgi:hypothetical protein